MPLRKMHHDEHGPWVAAGGWVARPFAPSALAEHERVSARHVGGSTDAIVESPDGITREVWTVTGIEANAHRAGRVSKQELDESIVFYRVHRNPKVPNRPYPHGED